MHDKFLINSIKSELDNKSSWIAYAPGRIEILGNHTDYNLGTTLSAAINFGVYSTITMHNNEGTLAISLNTKETIRFDSNLNYREKTNLEWEKYVQGILKIFRNKTNCDFKNLKFIFAGNIPLGGGLSSSAALEISLLFALQKKFNTDFTLLEIAKMAQQAEHQYVGCECGLLDQLSSIFGGKNRLIFSDFNNLKTNQIDLPENVVFLVINPNIKHKLSNSPYNDRRKSCENAVKAFNKLIKKSIKSLRDINSNDYDLYHTFLNKDDAKRSKHVIDEIMRVNNSISLLSKEKIEDFGLLLFDSHESSRLYFENSCNELDIIVNAAKNNGALGARLSGGGWGGIVIALTYADKAKILSKNIVNECLLHGMDLKIDIITPSNGAEIINIQERN